ncbi:MAG: S41 family peptidase [Candidatus Aminicenantes bacterium]|jgi:carboxyl-terminal processing protease
MKKCVVFSLLFFSIVLSAAWEEDVWTNSLSKISAIMSIIEDNYYKNVDAQEMAYSSIKGMLQTLDPHSNFLDMRRMSRLTEDYRAKYFGTGMLIQQQGNRIVVISPIVGGPAYRLGVQPGDWISRIDGESIKGISSYEAMQRLRGKKGTKVTITVVREGMEPFDLTIEREEIPLYSVPYAFLLEENIGYVFIRNFAETTPQELREKMELLTGQGMNKLILDLRQNGGGAFPQSLEISDEFLPKGSVIVSIRGRKEMYNREIRAIRNNQYERIPLVVLIDSGSASASEILSGAVKDNDRGLIVGETSFGKGLVQTVFPLTSDAAVSLTIAKYFTPSGRSIQKDYSNLEDYLLQSYRQPQEIPEEKREVHYTSQGRKVLGQGGITPDYEVSSKIKLFTWRLRSTGAFFTYARKFVTKKTELSKQYILPEEKEKKTSDLKRIRISKENFVVDSTFVQDFKNHLQDLKFTYDSENFEDASDEIKREIKKEIFSSLWGQEQGWKVLMEHDPVVKKAIEILPESEALLKKSLQSNSH